MSPIRRVLAVCPLLAACATTDGGSGVPTPTSSTLVSSCPDVPPSCDALAAARADLEARWTTTLAAEDHDALLPLGACNEAIVEAQFAAPGSCGLRACAEICRLHPCAAQSNCEARCAVEASALTPEQLLAIVGAAANTPGVCTCDACASDTFSFCAQVWQCNAG